MGRTDRDAVRPGDRDRRTSTDRGDRGVGGCERSAERAEHRAPVVLVGLLLAINQPGRGSPSVASGMGSQTAPLAVVGGAAANRPLEIASQPSAGHAYERMVRTASVPDAPCWASAARVGVASASTSVQRMPPVPISTTGPGTGAATCTAAAVGIGARVHAAAATPPATSASRPIRRAPPVHLAIAARVGDRPGPIGHSRRGRVGR